MFNKARTHVAAALVYCRLLVAMVSNDAAQPHAVFQAASTYRPHLLSTRFALMQAALELAKGNWAASLQHLLSQAPTTVKETQLWLHLMHVVNRLLETHAVTEPALQLLALSLRHAALPVLGSKQAAAGTPSLPLALTSHADAAALFGQAQVQLTSIEVTQVVPESIVSWVVLCTIWCNNKIT